MAEVVCLNRTADSEARQIASMEEKGLFVDFESKAVRFMRTDLSKPHLGLALEAYRQSVEQSTHIIHNAWQVDFNVSLEQLARTHLQGVRQLSALCSGGHVPQRMSLRLPFRKPSQKAGKPPRTSDMPSLS